MDLGKQDRACSNVDSANAKRVKAASPMRASAVRIAAVRAAAGPRGLCFDTSDGARCVGGFPSPRETGVALAAVSPGADASVCGLRGFFTNGGTRYRANSAGHYCAFASLADWLAAGGPPQRGAQLCLHPVADDVRQRLSVRARWALCNGQCVDVSEDGNNCGRCGNTCSAADCCSGGSCAAETVCGCGIQPRPCRCGPRMTGYLCPGDVCSCF
jgi:hypothetical protein